MVRTFHVSMVVVVLGEMMVFCLAASRNSLAFTIRHHTASVFGNFIPYPGQMWMIFPLVEFFVASCSPPLPSGGANPRLYPTLLLYPDLRQAAGSKGPRDPTDGVSVDHTSKTYLLLISINYELLKCLKLSHVAFLCISCSRSYQMI
jgi:hypothetical protein